MSSYEDYVRSFNQSKVPHHKSKIFEEPQLLKFGRLIKIGQGLFPRVLHIDEIFYTFLSVKGSIYYVKGFDDDWQFTGFEKRLTPEEERDVDQDIAFDGEYIYEYCMRRPSFGPGGPRPGPQQGPGGPRPGPQQGPGGQIRKFDKEFNLVNKTPIFKGNNETILDQNIAFIKGKIYAGSEYRENDALWRKKRMEQGRGMQNIPPNPEVARATHLRVYDTNLNLLEERDLVANIKNAVIPHQYWGLGASQLYADGYYCVVAHSPIGNISKFDKGSGIGTRQIFILRFDDNFNFVDSKGPLSDTNFDNFWCTGSWYEDERYYISYASRSKDHSPESREPSFKNSLRLSIFDKEFNELETIILDGGLSKILKIDNKLYVSYMKGREGAFVQELYLKS